MRVVPHSDIIYEIKNYYNEYAYVFNDGNVQYITAFLLSESKRCKVKKKRNMLIEF